jgi:hypothetical protein
MATGNIKYQVLDVGQGLGNFVEIYDTTGKLTSTILLDLGSSREAELAGGPSVAYIVAKLKEMDQPTIDTVFLSHSDKDHTNLVPDLLRSFYPVGTDGQDQKDTLQINVIRYGGDSAKYRRAVTDDDKVPEPNILNLAEAYGPLVGGVREPNIEAFSAGESSFVSGAASKPFRTVDEVDIYIIIANAGETELFKSGRKRSLAQDDYAVNTNSLLVVVSFAGQQFVSTGDATAMTMAQANTVLTNEIKQGVPERCLHGDGTASRRL